MITVLLLAGYVYPLVRGGYIGFSQDAIGFLVSGLVYYPIDLLDSSGNPSTILNWIIPDPIRKDEFYSNQSL